MAVTGIGRDFSTKVSIVRMTSTNTIAEVGAAGYITAQAANITAVNNGDFTWLDNDVVLVSASDDEDFFRFVAGDFGSLVPVNPGDVITPVVAGNFAVFANTGGTLEDAEFAPSDPTFPTVVMGTGAYTPGNVTRFADAAGSVANSSIVATDIQVKSGVIVTKTANIGGFGAGPFDVTVTGMTAASVVVCSVNQASNSCFVKSAVEGTGKFVITMSADPGASCIISYIAYLAAQHP